MLMPSGTGTGIERYHRTTNSRRLGRLEQRINAYRSGKIFGRSLAGILRTRSLYLHVDFSQLSSLNFPTAAILRQRALWEAVLDQLDRSTKDPFLNSSPEEIPIPRVHR